MRRPTLRREPIDRGSKRADVERFWKHEMHVHAFVSGADFGGNMGGKDHDLAVDPAFPQLLDELDPAHVRHFLIDNDDVVMLGAGIDARESGISIFDCGEIVAGRVEDVTERKGDRRFIIDRQNPERSSAHDNKKQQCACRKGWEG